MILGIGTDTIEIHRIETAISKESFLKRYFTEKEIAMYLDRGKKAQVLAANFAAKEAVAKALGTGFFHFSPIDMEILRNEKGAPFVLLYGNCKNFASQMGVQTIHISLSHNKTHAIAFAVAEGMP
ncbi:MAG: holo-ACP synthase [Epulopiscium sp.]|jgi:holo-[acyl-carrier protein] synthase|nr:holo-ACP synthase [Candidatus Epulonipiscium sp.]